MDACTLRGSLACRAATGLPHFRSSYVTAGGKVTNESSRQREDGLSAVRAVGGSTSGAQTQADDLVLHFADVYVAHPGN